MDADQDEGGAELDAEVQMRAGEEAVLLVKRGVPRDKTSPSRTVRRAAGDERLEEVVRPRLDVEDEVQGPARDKDLQHVSARHCQASFHGQSRQKRQRVGQAEARQSDLDRAERDDEALADGLCAVDCEHQAQVSGDLDGEHGERRIDIMPHPAKVISQQPREVEAVREALHVSGEALLRVALGQFGFKLKNLLHPHVTALAHLGVLLHRHAAAADDGVVPGEDVLREVNTLGGL
mmetsp:Transcript_13185/g.44060  ORF Transcript_13185/g.44060 Transcript_13185/m.44060 type:complete len:235 (+) Transcript_13185:1394-2098(+)